MKTSGPYDSTLQMFVEAPREADLRRIRFLRWLAEHGKLEHEVAGPPCGRYTLEGSEAAMIEAPIAA